MKVGIMSMQRIFNYGSLMQAYSLKQIIESLGHEVVFVDYHISPTIYNKNSITQRVRFGIKNLLKQYLPGTKVEYFLKQILNRNNYHRERFYTFYNRLGLSLKYNYRSKVDVLVIGSDEVFNCLQHGDTVGYSKELFGCRNRAKKVITYAASFGSTTLSGIKKYGIQSEIRDCLKRIETLSVRDKNSYDIINSLTSNAPLTHLDPVLVGELENEEWTPCKEENYVVIYGYYMRFSEKECSDILDYAHSIGLNVIALGEEQPLYDKFIECRPDELLSFFKSASFVVTDTFHGTIFSIIFQKQFITLPRKSINGTGGNTEKIGSLLETFNLSNRATDSLDEIDRIINTSIDFCFVESIRSKERERTLVYLKNNIK